MTQRQVFETTFHVRYAETDQMGVVHHAAYIVWFEEGRSAWMRALGSNYADFESAGYNHIIMTGYRNNGCQANELYAVGFRALKDGQQITGVACAGTESGLRIVHE